MDLNMRIVSLMLALGVGPALADGHLVAEDQTPSGKFLTATEVKPILSATKGNWIAVREWDGQDLIYVTHLWAWRCGLLEIEVSVNDLPPKVWPMPPCRPDSTQPTAILEQDGLPYQSFGLNSVHTIAVEVTYDDLSNDAIRVSRSEVLMP